MYPTTEMSSKESQNTAEIVSPPSPERLPHTQTSGSCFYHVISKVPRIRTPSYSPTQRSPGCRPLPSAGKRLHLSQEGQLKDEFVILSGNFILVTFAYF